MCSTSMHMLALLKRYTICIVQASSFVWGTVDEMLRRHHDGHGLCRQQPALLNTAHSSVLYGGLQ